MAEDRFAPIAEQVHTLLETGQQGSLHSLLLSYQATEIAEYFEDFTPEEQIRILGSLPTDLAVDVFECLEEPDQMDLLNRFRRERQATFLREMEPDERADLFQALPDDLANKFMAMLPREEKEEVRELVAHEPQTAGGLMTPGFAWISPAMTTAQAIEKFRQNYSELEMVYYFYVIDDEQKLVGLVSMRQLLMNSPDAQIQSFMFRNVISVLPNTDQEEAAQILTLYDFYALPVVDESKHMLGIVTFDDVADVMTEEATKDLERFGAVLPSEQSYERTSVWRHVMRRVPWLVILLVLSSISGFVIILAQKSLVGSSLMVSENPPVNSQMMLFALLVALFPMLTATAGNAGTQVATLIIRGIATGEIEAEDRWKVLWKEIFVGLSIGIVLAVIGSIRAMMGADPRYWWLLGISVSGALVAMLIIANLMGALLPLLFERLGWDPALMSGPLIATLTDIFSAIVYFSIAIVVVRVVFPFT